MHLLKTISTKTLGQTTPGDLVKTHLDGDSLFAIVLDPRAKQPIVGFLQPTGKFSFPVYRRQPPATKCISYGKDWALEAEPTKDTWPGNSNHQADSGALFIADQALIVCFQPGSEDHGDIEIYFNLVKNAPEDRYPLDLAAPILNWRIWESKEEYYRPGAEPLIEVSAIPGR
jgi:hypothetical protein